MSRTYSDPSYGAKQNVVLPSTGALNGTAASAASVIVHTFMQPVTVSDWNGMVVTGGTDAGVISLIIGKSAAGTGAVSAIGTMALSTHATDTVIDGSLTSTDFATGDDIVIQRSAGTSTSSLTVQPVVQYTENFVESDS